MNRVYRLCEVHGVVDAYPEPYDSCPLCADDWGFLCMTPKDRETIRLIRANIERLDFNERQIALRDTMNIPEELYMAAWLSRRASHGIDLRIFKEAIKNRRPDEPGLRPNGNDAYIAFAGTMERFIRNNITRGKRNGLESGHQKRLELRNSRETETRKKEGVASTSS